MPRRVPLALGLLAVWGCASDPARPGVTLEVVDATVAPVEVGEVLTVTYRVRNRSGEAVSVAWCDGQPDLVVRAGGRRVLGRACAEFAPRPLRDGAVLEGEAAFTRYDASIYPPPGLDRIAGPLEVAAGYAVGGEPRETPGVRVEVGVR